MKQTRSAVLRDAQATQTQTTRDEDLSGSWSSVTSDGESGATVVTHGSSDLSRSPSPLLINKGTFPEVLFEILSDERNSSAITWLPSGRSFVIVDRDKLSAEVLARYFGGKSTKYTSFTRKLSRWGFTRVQADSDLKAYDHKFFRRDGASLHRMVQHRGTKSDEDHKKPLQVLSKVLPIKKRPVDQSLLKKTIGVTGQTIPTRSKIGNCVGSAGIESLLANNLCHHNDVASQQQVFNDAVLALLRGSTLYSSSAMTPAGSLGVHPHVLASAGLTYGRR